MKRIAFLVSLILLFSVSAFAAGTVKITDYHVGMIRYVTFAWTSDASGDVSATGTSFNMRGGTVYAFLADPETGVTDAYDITIQAEWSIPTESSTRTIEFADVLDGAAANLSNSTDGEFEMLTTPIGLPGCKIDITVANAGNAQSGTFVLLIWEE